MNLMAVSRMDGFGERGLETNISAGQNEVRGSEPRGTKVMEGDGYRVCYEYIV